MHFLVSKTDKHYDTMVSSAFNSEFCNVQLSFHKIKSVKHNRRGKTSNKFVTEGGESVSMSCWWLMLLVCLPAMFTCVSACLSVCLLFCLSSVRPVSLSHN